MKRFFLALIASLSFLSINCYADGPDPVEQVIYSMVIGEELLLQACEDQNITSSSCYINSIDYVIGEFALFYRLLPSSYKTDLSGVTQILEKNGLFDGQKPAYLNQTTLQVLMQALVDNSETLTQLTEEIGAFVVKYQSEIKVIPPAHVNLDDVENMRELSNLLGQLVSTPELLSNDDFLNSLYNAFIKNGLSFYSYQQQLMLFNFDMVMADVFVQQQPLFPPPEAGPAFENQESATERMKSLMLNLVEGGNFLFFKNAVSHLQVGINSMNSGNF